MTNGAVIERALPAAKTTVKKVKGTAIAFTRGWTYNPHPSRTKFMLIGKTAMIIVPVMLIVKRTIGHFMHKDD